MDVMDGTDFLFEENTRVRLKDVSPDYYGGQACVGNEGWIRKNSRDKFDLPKVWVEWDKNHWTYNGVPDGWTFQDHFEAVVEEPQMSEPTKADIARQAANAFADTIAGLFTEQEKPAEETPKANPQTAPKSPGERLLEATQAISEPEPTEEEVQDAVTNADFRKAVLTAAEEMARSEAFVVVGMTREPHPATPDGVLIPYAIGIGRSPELEMLVKAQLGGYAAQAHTELALKAIADASGE